MGAITFGLVGWSVMNVLTACIHCPIAEMSSLVLDQIFTLWVRPQAHVVINQNHPLITKAK